MNESNIILGNLVHSENIRQFLDGSTRSVVRLRSAAIGMGTYEPGWKWSLHAVRQLPVLLTRLPPGCVTVPSVIFIINSPGF